MNSIKITKELAREYTELLIFIYGQNLDKKALLNHIQNKTEVGIKVLTFLEKLGGNLDDEIEDFVELALGDKFVED